MKKSIIITSIAVLTIFVSCKKNYVCSCKTHVTSGGATVVEPEINHAISNLKKQVAIDSCNAGDKLINTGNTTTTTNCEIK